jgi:hypothetical protein
MLVGALGLELPALGVDQFLGARSHPGWGYHIGTALSWDITPVVTLRLYGAWSEAKGGDADVTFTRAGSLGQSSAPADWFNLELGLGGEARFVVPRQAWSPVLGARAGLGFGGFAFRLQDALAEFKAQKDFLGELSQGQHFATGLAPSAWLVGGIRYDMAAWLMSMWTLDLGLSVLSDQPVSNTVEGPKVHSPAQLLWTLRTTFAVRFAAP